ncbi:MAG: aspartyl/asparaginyl beta-hydroxylase domain-containing protein [Sphingomonadales bacterium]
MNEGAIPNLMAEAAAAQQGGNPARAEALYAQVLKIAPNNAAALNSLGVIALNSGNARRAIEFYARATVVDPNAPILWVNLARAWRAVPDDFEERKALDKALSIDPTTFTALVRKGELHERRGEDVDAMQTWQAVINYAPATRGGGIDDVLAHARTFVSTRLDRLSAAMDAGLVDARSAAAGSLRRVDACVDAMLGKRRIYVNECAGVHVPFLPADEYFERSLFPWLAAFEAHTDAIRAELVDLLETGAPGFAPYVQQSPGTPENKWTPLDGQTAWSAYYLWHYGKPVAEAHKRCPKTVAALGEVPLVDLPGRMPNVFFSILQPGAHIPPHTGVTNLRAIIHLPLIVPEGCQFRVGGETRAWREGEAIAFDDTIEHEATNPTGQVRAVLILDVWNPYLTEDERVVLARSLEIADEVGLGAGVVD